MLLRFALVDQIRVRPDQKLVLEAEVPDAQLKEFPVARFLASAAEAGEGRRVLTVDRDTKEFFLRLDYRPRHLVKITQAGYYPVELRVRPADEDLVAEFAFLGTGTGARQRLDMLRFFPGQAPTISNYSGLLATRVLESTTQVLVSRLQPPPAIGWKILITMSEGAALFAVLQFVCFVPWGTSGGLSALFLVVAWFFGGWRGFLVLPQESTDTLVWMSLGLVCILFIHMPWCFARTPWFGGWSVDGRSLRVLARNKRRRAFFLMPGVDKLKIRVGGPRGFDWSDTSFDGQELTLIHPSRTALTPGRQLKLLANNQNVQLGIRPLKPGDVVILDDGARLRVRRRDLEFRAN